MGFELKVLGDRVMGTIRSRAGAPIRIRDSVLVMLIADDTSSADIRDRVTVNNKARVWVAVGVRVCHR